jgi:hypothetical protein
VEILGVVNVRKAGSTNRVSQLLPESVRSRLRAVVVDANAYGAVGPDVVGLADLAKDLHAIDIRTWVPEPVAWEWAQHLAQQWRSARAAIRTPAGHLRRAGLVSHLRLEPDYEDEAELVEAFLRRLRVIPHVEVIALTGASAVAGLRDQILLRAPAKTKSTPAVKTGGSDSAWLRDVLAKVDGAADALLFLSSDGDIESAYAQWGHQPPLLRSLVDIRVSLFEDLPAAVGEAWMLADYLAGRMPADLQSPPDSDLIDATVGLIGALEPDLGGDGLVDAYLTRLTALAGLHRITRKQPDVASADGADAEDRATVHTFWPTLTSWPTPTPS